MTHIFRSATVLAVGGLLATALAACGSGTDRAVSGPTTPPASTAGAASTGTPAASPADGSTDGVASGEPVVATTPGAPAASATDRAPGAGGASGTATAGLIAGFPKDVVPVVPGATVTASAARRSGDRLEVSLSGTTAKYSARQVLGFYDRAFKAKGFTTADGGATIAPGTGGRIYARGDEVIVVAVARADGVLSFSVGGTVRA